MYIYISSTQNRIWHRINTQIFTECVNVLLTRAADNIVFREMILKGIILLKKNNHKLDRWLTKLFYQLSSQSSILSLPLPMVNQSGGKVISIPPQNQALSKGNVCLSSADSQFQEKNASFTCPESTQYFTQYLVL